MSNFKPVKTKLYDAINSDVISWDGSKPYLLAVISAIDPDIIVAIEIKNTKTDDFLIYVLNSFSLIYSKGVFL